MELQKVEIGNKDFDCYECPRCNQHECNHCNDPVEVGFEVSDASDGSPGVERDWKGLDVCPFCYNQLIDIKLQEVKD